MTQAETVLEEFRRGEQFRPPATRLFPGRLSGGDLDVLAAALESEPEAVREQIVQMLVDYSWRSDPLFQSGGQVIRDPHMISILAGSALKRPGPARDAALDALQQWAPPPSLQPHGEVLAADLKHTPGSASLLLIAKAKPASAAVTVKRLLATSRWSNDEACRVAAAALGDLAIEKEFGKPFLATRDGDEQAHLAQVLGWIGTSTALKALAIQMRTDLKAGVPHAFMKSVRLDIMAALSYNFPELIFLYPDSVKSDADYERVEQFCEQRFGVKWSRSRPPFLTILGYPAR